MYPEKMIITLIVLAFSPVMIAWAQGTDPSQSTPIPTAAPASADGQQTFTGPQGQHRTFTSGIQGDTGTIERSFTGPNGQMRDYQRTWNADGSTTRQSFVGPQGQSHTMTRTVTGDTVQIEQNFVGPNGQTRTVQRTIGPDGMQMEQSRTGPTQQPGVVKSAGDGSGAAASAVSQPAPSLQPRTGRRRSGFTIGSSAKGGWGWGRQAARDQRLEEIQSPAERSHAQEHRTLPQEQRSSRANSTTHGGRS